MGSLVTVAVEPQSNVLTNTRRINTAGYQRNQQTCNYIFVTIFKVMSPLDPLPKFAAVKIDVGFSLGRYLSKLPQTNKQQH